MKRVVFTLLTLALLCALAAPSFAAERPFRSTWAWPTYIDPAVGSDNSSSTAMGNLYDSLVFPDSKGNPVAHVAKSWTISEDGMTWTFKLRDDVKFHNGDPLTSADVKYSMDRLLTIGEGYAHLFIGKVKAVETPDKSTVVFKLSTPFGPFLTTLYRLYILNSKQVEANIAKPGPYADKGDYGKKWLVSHDAGSGPYKVKEFKVEERLVMELVPSYWQKLDANVPDEYTMIGTTEAITVRTLMSRRELEVCDRWQSNESLTALGKLNGVSVASIKVPGEFYGMIHTRKPPTDDIHVRKAMILAVDYATVNKHLFPGTTQARGPIPEILPGYDPSVQQHHRNLELAKEELKKSKYWGKLDQYPVTFHWIAEVPDEEKVAMLFMYNMNEIGINVEVVKVPWMTVVDEMAAEDTSPNIVTIFDDAHYPEASALLQSRYSSESAKTWEQNEWLLDKHFDEMLEDAIQTMDPKARFAKYSKLQKYINEKFATIFFFDMVAKHAYQSEYVEWPAATGEPLPVQGYDLLGRYLKIFPEKRAKLLGK